MRTIAGGGSVFWLELPLANGAGDGVIGDGVTGDVVTGDVVTGDGAPGDGAPEVAPVRAVPGNMLVAAVAPVLERRAASESCTCWWSMTC